MAFSQKSQLLLFSLLCIFFSLCLSFNPSRTNEDDVHDLLPSYNLPKGLLPNNVKSYTLSPKDNSFTVQLTHPCYVQFKDQLVYYEKEIKGKLSYGEVSDVSGIQAKKVFIWVSVTGINVDEESHIIEFHVGFLSEKLPAKEFENIPTCKNKGCSYGARSRDDPTTLLVRNLRHDCRPEDLKKPFGQIGPVKDIYLPRDYYTREPRGFGFIQYLDPADAAEAKYQMDGQVFQGRQLTVVFAEENRKKPTEMRARERGSGGRGGRNYERRGSPPRYHNSPRYSRSPPPRGRDYYSPPKRRSVSPDEKRYCRERSYSPRGGQGRTHSQSPPREQSPPYNGSRSRSQSPVREHSPPYNGSRSRSRSPVRAHSPVRGHSRRRNYVKSYTLSPKDNSFTVQLTHPCYVQFQDQLVYYEKEIKGKLSYGEVSDVSGIQVKKVFIWVSVTGINVDEESHIIEFHVGFLSEKLPAKEFENIPTCKNKGCQDSPLASI